GQIIDERPVASRIESISLDIDVQGTSGPPTTVRIGDPGTPATSLEKSSAVTAALDLEEQAKLAAAKRRFSTFGELGTYLRWRFSCRAGALLILDAYLFYSGSSEV